MIVHFQKLCSALIVLSLTVLLSSCSDAQSDITKISSAKNGGFNALKIADGLSSPWGAHFISEDELLVTEKGGQLKLLNLSSGLSDSISLKGLPSLRAIGQGGLLDVKASPSFSTDRTFYLTYADEAESSNGYVLKLAKAKYKQGNSITDFQVLFTSNSPSSGGRHFGSRIAFDQQGHIFFSMGDRGERDNSQDLSLHSGSIFRLNMDGSVPKNNPFVSSPQAQPEIWSYGHRNPQGMFFDIKSQQLWSNEHGPRGGDEINLIEKGKNYGWPIAGYGKEYMSWQDANESTHRDGMQQPVKQYTPSIAPSSLLVYSGKKYPELAGVLFAGALKLKHLNVVQLNTGFDLKTPIDKPKDHLERRWFEDLSERVRNVIESPAGDIIFMTDSGSLYRLER